MVTQNQFQHGTPIETQIPQNTPTPTEEPVTSVDDIDINSDDFYDKIVKEFKTFYANEYNLYNKEDSLSADDFIIKPNEAQDRIYKIKVGDEYRCISHGDRPEMIEQYFKNNNIEPESINNCFAISIYSADSNKNAKTAYDEFGNMSKIKLDSAVRLNGEYVKLYDGNNPQDILNPKSSSFSLLAEMGDIANVLSLPSNTEVYRNDIKKIYTNKVSEYQAKHSSTNQKSETKHGVVNQEPEI